MYAIRSYYAQRQVGADNVRRMRGKPGAGGLQQRGVAGDVVVVAVGIGHQLDRDTMLAGCGKHRLGGKRRIDDDAATLLRAIDQVGEVGAFV